jgi:murein DD-endopeptidase MepM/ murein hydrolase activator NlpD
MKKSIYDKTDSGSTNKFIKFFKKNGFYIVLLSCITIVAVTAFLVTRYNLNYYSKIGSIDDYSVMEQAENSDILKTDDIAETSANVSEGSQQPIIEYVGNNSKKDEENKHNDEKDISTIVPTNKVDEKQNISETSTKNIEEKKKEEKEPITFMWPVKGEIILDFAKDTLIYSKTLEEWRTHSGVDIKGDMGTQVKAATDGIIEKVYKDDGLGISIIIDHENGLKTKYSNLSTESMVKPNQKVEQGDVISGIGDSAIFEIGDQAHLHFEIIKDGENIDPKTILPR